MPTPLIIPKSPYRIKSLNMKAYQSPSAYSPGLYDAMDFDGDTQRQLIPVKNIRQTNDYFCWPCCVAMICHYWGVGPKNVPTIAKALGTNRATSTHPYVARDYLKSLGLQVEDKHEMTVENLVHYWNLGYPVLCAIQEYGDPLEEEKHPDAKSEKGPDAEFDYGHAVVYVGGPALGLIFVQDPSIENIMSGEHADNAVGLMPIEMKKWLKCWHDQDQYGNKFVRYGIAVGPPRKGGSNSIVPDMKSMSEEEPAQEIEQPEIQGTDSSKETPQIHYDRPVVGITRRPTMEEMEYVQQPQPIAGPQQPPVNSLYQHVWSGDLPAVPNEISEQNYYSGFVRSIQENPKDSSNWLMFSDWLEENGQDVIANHIRIGERLEQSVGQVDWNSFNHLDKETLFRDFDRIQKNSVNTIVRSIPKNGKVTQLYQLVLHENVESYFPQLMGFSIDDLPDLATAYKNFVRQSGMEVRQFLYGLSNSNRIQQLFHNASNIYGGLNAISYRYARLEGKNEDEFRIGTAAGFYQQYIRSYQWFLQGMLPSDQLTHINIRGASIRQSLSELAITASVESWYGGRKYNLPTNQGGRVDLHQIKMSNMVYSGALSIAKSFKNAAKIPTKKSYSIWLKKSFSKSLIASGLAVQAQDTGRVLMLQRSLQEEDENGGKWEFPGGHIEKGEEPEEAAEREWQEEVGLKLPKGKVDGEWNASNGKYRGFVYHIPKEEDLDLTDRNEVPNPDGDYFEAAAWVHPEDFDNHNLREELLTDLKEVRKVVKSATPMLPTRSNEQLLKTPRSGGNLTGQEPETHEMRPVWYGTGEGFDPAHPPLNENLPEHRLKKLEEKHAPTLAMDLDGTLAEYDGWKGEDHFGAVRPGAKEAMQKFKDAGLQLIIFTTRGRTDLVEKWLKENSIPFDFINENPNQPEGTSGKVIADLYIDDRGVDARGDWDKITQQVEQRLKEGTKSLPPSQCPICGSHKIKAFTEGELGWRCTEAPCEWSITQAGAPNAHMEAPGGITVIHNQEEWERSPAGQNEKVEQKDPLFYFGPNMPNPNKKDLDQPTCPDGTIQNRNTNSCDGHNVPTVTEMGIEQQDHRIGGEIPSSGKGYISPGKDASSGIPRDYPQDWTFWFQAYNRWRVKPDILGERRLTIGYDDRKSPQEMAQQNDEEWRLKEQNNTKESQMEQVLHGPERHVLENELEIKGQQICPNGEPMPPGAGTCAGMQADSWDGVVDKQNKPGWPEYPDYAPVSGVDTRPEDERETPIVGQTDFFHGKAQQICPDGTKKPRSTGTCDGRYGEVPWTYEQNQQREIQEGTLQKSVPQSISLPGKGNDAQEMSQNRDWLQFGEQQRQQRTLLEPPLGPQPYQQAPMTGKYPNNGPQPPMVSSSPYARKSLGNNKYNRAVKADLITLPKGVTGTSCANCFWVDKDYCKHPSLELELWDGAKQMSCSYWWREGAKHPDGGKEDRISLPVVEGSEIERAKKADLITLPKDAVEAGTSCANCEYQKDKYCHNKKVDQKVTPQNCCNYWNSTEAKRKWEKGEKALCPNGTEMPQGIGTCAGRGRPIHFHDTENYNSIAAGPDHVESQEQLDDIGWKAMSWLGSGSGGDIVAPPEFTLKKKRKTVPLSPYRIKAASAATTGRDPHFTGIEYDTLGRKNCFMQGVKVACAQIGEDDSDTPPQYANPLLNGTQHAQGGLHSDEMANMATTVPGGGTVSYALIFDDKGRLLVNMEDEELGGIVWTVVPNRRGEQYTERQLSKMTGKRLKLFGKMGDPDSGNGYYLFEVEDRYGRKALEPEKPKEPEPPKVPEREVSEAKPIEPMQLPEVAEKEKPEPEAPQVSESVMAEKETEGAVAPIETIEKPEAEQPQKTAQFPVDEQVIRAVEYFKKNKQTQKPDYNSPLPTEQEVANGEFYSFADKTVQPDWLGANYRDLGKLTVSGKHYFYKGGLDLKLASSEVVASQVGQVLGVPVPNARIVRTKSNVKKVGVVSSWVDGHTVQEIVGHLLPGQVSNVLDNLVGEDEVDKQILFSWMTEIVDRHLANYMVSGNRLVSIDHEFLARYKRNKKLAQQLDAAVSVSLFACKVRRVTDEAMSSGQKPDLEAVHYLVPLSRKAAGELLSGAAEFLKIYQSADQDMDAARIKVNTLQRFSESNDGTFAGLEQAYLQSLQGR